MSITHWFASVVVLAFVSTAAPAAERPEPPKPTSRTVRNIEGWNVRVDDRLLRAPNKELGVRVLKALEAKLADIKAVVPPIRLEKLQGFAIVLDLSHGFCRSRSSVRWRSPRPKAACW